LGGGTGLAERIKFKHAGMVRTCLNPANIAFESMTSGGFVSRGEKALPMKLKSPIIIDHFFYEQAKRQIEASASRGCASGGLYEADGVECLRGCQGNRSDTHCYQFNLPREAECQRGNGFEARASFQCLA
jgi:hypothetical protein